MLFHWLRDPHSGVDIEQLVVHLPEPIDSTKLKAACERLVARHEILRARFAWESPENSQQEILETVEVPFSVRGSGNERESDQHSVWRRFLEEDRVRGFDLSTAPLLRFTLFEWGASSFSLVWTFHHALLDGRCYPVLLRELFEFYENTFPEQAPNEGTAAFRRHIEWLHNHDHIQSSAFWRNYLDSFRAPTPLVVDHKPIQLEFPQGEVWQNLDALTTLRLREYAANNDLTMNSMVMGAWSILLHRYSGETDIVFGATRACRKSSATASAEGIGLYINTIPVRVKLSEDSAVPNLLRELRTQWTALRAVEHTPLAFVKSVSQIPASQPLFETLLVFEKYRLDDAMRSIGGRWASRRVELHELTNFPVTLAAYDGAELSFKIEFDRRRISEESAGRMLGHLRCLLQEMASRPDSTVGDLHLLQTEEERSLIEDNRREICGQAPQIPLSGNTTLHTLFEDRVRQHPDRIALTCDGVSLSYGELNRRANRLAGQLVDSGVGPDALVGLSLERSSNLVVAILAVLKAGGAYVPIDLTYPAERLQFIVDDAQASVLITEKKLASSLPGTAAKVICVDDPVVDDGRGDLDQNFSSGAAADNLAYVIYTSGTTGKPKGSLITHRNVVRLFASTEQWFHFDHNDVWTMFHSAAFDFSVWEIWGALLYGGRLVVVPFLTSRSPESFHELLQSEQVTVLNQTPSAFRQLIQVDESKPNHSLALRYVIFGGEALEMESLRPWFVRHGDRHPQLVNMYGITETTVHVTYRPLAEKDLDSGSVIGVPIPDLQVYILDSRKRPVPVRVPGEMYVGGAGLARGYLRRPDLTEQRFLPNHFSPGSSSRLYRTGDLARFLPGNEIEYLGRIDDQVKIRGFRIELGEVESVLRQHAAVREVAVMAREITPGTKQLVAYVVASGTRIELTDLREFLKRKLPDYMVPAAFVFLPSLPLTNNGKVDRKALPMPEPERPELNESFQAPRNELERKLARIWGKVLSVERVGINDNFFELGGDSILSIQIIALARRQGIRLTPKQLFENQTIQELCAVAAVEADAQAVQENLAGDFGLTPVQSWFFEQNLEEPHYYNQAFLFDVSFSLNFDCLAGAIRAVDSHHDALRLRFSNRNGLWRQSYSPGDRAPALELVNLRDVAILSQAEAIRAASVKAQSTLNIEDGPLWRAVYFELGKNRPSKLLIAVHHLAVDGVSWRPLLEDLESAYKQISDGRQPQLPAKTASFKKWQGELLEYAAARKLQAELPHWSFAEASIGRDSGSDEDSLANLDAGCEGDAHSLVKSLSAAETLTLLQKIPGFYRCQSNDVLLAALVLAWRQWCGKSAVHLALEGHGRESLLNELDVSRTVGWFTSIYPVRLEIAAPADRAGAVASIRNQLEAVPGKGVGYGVLRYLSGDLSLSRLPAPQIIFNYLGQFERTLNDSTLFRLAEEDPGAWHSPAQRRRFAVEVTCVVVHQQMQLRWTVPASSREAFASLFQGFVRHLEGLIEDCANSSELRPEPSPPTLKRREPDSSFQPPLREEAYPLSPTQSLYNSANPVRLSTSFDQWHCTLEGELEIALFQRVWQETVNRHSILRSSIHNEQSQEPFQRVASFVEPSWDVLDWSALPDAEMDRSWNEYLHQDRLKPLDLGAAPVMRFALARLPRGRWKFLWSLPALFLDGWSWPIVFREASLRYQALLENSLPQLDPAPPYRHYLSWLDRRPKHESDQFWGTMLSDFVSPTRVFERRGRAGKAGKAFGRVEMVLQKGTWDSLQDISRRCRLTTGALIQAAWALLLAQKNGTRDVVYGAAFSGRPTDLENAEWIVGPFVTTLPVRVRLGDQDCLADYLQRVHQLLLSISQHQFHSLAEIQRLSQIPGGHRLFESLVVYQNYQVGAEARFFGGQVPIKDFVGPIHTNYPLLLLGQPSEDLSLTLIYDSQLVLRRAVEDWGRDLAAIMDGIAQCLDKRLAEVWSGLSAPLRATDPEDQASADVNFVPPQSKSEAAIAAVWQQTFGLERISVEENFFDLGGHSLLLLQMHRALQETLYPTLSVVTLFENPTVRSLARYMDELASPRANGSADSRSRALHQRGALQQMRERLKKTVS
jgi:amino acid adenylation domain-containing protein/non-ribosomal peptide synthase protein (TIGR01720 family)